MRASPVATFLVLLESRPFPTLLLGEQVRNTRVAVLRAEEEEGTRKLTREEHPEPAPLEPVILPSIDGEAGGVNGNAPRAISRFSRPANQVGLRHRIVTAIEHLLPAVRLLRDDGVVERAAKLFRVRRPILEPSEEQSEVAIRRDVRLLEILGEALEGLDVGELDLPKAWVHDPDTMPSLLFDCTLPPQRQPQETVDGRGVHNPTVLSLAERAPASRWESHGSHPNLVLSLCKSLFSGHSRPGLLGKSPSGLALRGRTFGEPHARPITEDLEQVVLPVPATY